MDVKKLLLEKIGDGSFALLTAREIARLLRLGKRESDALNGMLLSLCREGELLVDSRGRFGTAAQFSAVRGVFSGNERGFGFVTPETGDDLFIPRRSVNGALHGDTVLAFRIGDGDEGEVLAVLGRGCRELVGTYRRERQAGYLVPDEKKFSSELYIPAGKHKGCKTGQKAVARILSYKGTLTGEIIEVLGSGGELFTEELALIRAHSLREEFPAAVLREAAALPQSVPSSAFGGRADFRNTLVVTVDGEDTRDIDDAISLEEKDGNFYLGVHIADVSEYVARGSELDREAFARGTSVYFPDRVLPMLPKALSNGICSLNEGVDRLTLSCLVTLDGAGKVLRSRIVPSVINSRHRLTYSEVTALAEGDGAAKQRYPDLAEFVARAVRLTQILKELRKKRGGIDLDIGETKIVYSDGRIEIPNSERTVSHEMIEQFMVLANECVASFLEERKLPCVFRVHEPPSVDKAREFALFLSEAGIKPTFDPLCVSPRDYAALLSSLEGSPLYSLVNRVMLRSMSKAHYSPENVGHFGLASRCYCHFTSPIRRYPDLCVHRILKEALRGGDANGRYQNFVGEASARSSDCEKNAADAEREVDALYTVAYMQDKIGEEYEATVSGVTDFGLFAELANFVEGFIPIETLPDDCYEFYENRRMLRGTKHSYALGETLRVRVESVDWGTRRTRFAVLEP